MKRKLTFIAWCIVFFTSAQGPVGSGSTTIAPNLSNSSFSWFRGGNFSGGAAANNNILGTRWASDIWIMTNNVNMARFTTGSALTTPWDFNGIVSGSGHGLSIQTSSTASGNLDLFTAQQGTTQKNLENR